jgi:hypothetical protein
VCSVLPYTYVHFLVFDIITNPFLIFHASQPPIYFFSSVASSTFFCTFCNFRSLVRVRPTLLSHTNCVHLVTNLSFCLLFGKECNMNARVAQMTKHTTSFPKLTLAPLSTAANSTADRVCIMDLTGLRDSAKQFGCPSHLHPPAVCFFQWQELLRQL